MQLLEDYREALRRALGEIKEHGRLPESLPAEFTQSTLRYIRTEACRAKNPVIECRRWTMKDPDTGARLQEPSPALQIADDGTVAFSSYPCEGCQHRDRVKLERLVEELFNKENPHTNIWKRYAHQGARMKVDEFRVIVATAKRNGWLSWDQFATIMGRIDALDIARRALKAELARAKERQGYKEGSARIDMAKLERELREHANLAEQRTRKRLEDRKPHFSEKVRAAMQKIGL